MVPELPATFPLENWKSTVLLRRPIRGSQRNYYYFSARGWRLSPRNRPKEGESNGTNSRLHSVSLKVKPFASDAVSLPLPMMIRRKRRGGSPPASPSHSPRALAVRGGGGGRSHAPAALVKAGDSGSDVREEADLRAGEAAPPPRTESRGSGSSSAMVDYSVWDHIEVSDDEDETHPNIDTPSLFRWRHQARVERMEQFHKEKEEIDKGSRDCKRKLSECQKKIKELALTNVESNKNELQKLQAEAQQLKKEEKSWDKKVEELRKKEKNMPWNVDTLSKDGFSKSVFNVKTEQDEESEEQKEKKHKTFVEKYEKQIKHFGMLRHWDDSQKYLSDNPHLVCEETANYLVIWCIDLEVEEKHALMQQVAHQTIVMQFILELSKSLKVDPRACFRQFFAKIKTADQQYMEGFNDELESFKVRVQERAKARIERAMKEYEEEERQKRLGPGGLDPVDVYESLPHELQKCFDVKDVQMLQDSISKMDPTEAKYHMQRCIDSGLWVPNAQSAEGVEKGDKLEGVYEEVKKENSEEEKGNP